MKIYFAGSIRGGRKDQQLYSQIIDYLGQYGEVLTEHVGDPALTIDGNDGPTDSYIYNRDLEWLKTSDLLVAEVTTPSLGVGYELAKAEEYGIPVLCLFRPKIETLSAMIRGNSYFRVEEYKNIFDLEIIFREYIQGTRRKS